MKTLTELEAERVELARAVADTTALANDRAARAYHVQAVTTQHALKRASLGDLEKAQRELTESVDAVVRKQHLERSLAELDASIVVTRGRERAAYCQSVADEHAATYAEYKAQSKALLELFRRLIELDNRYMGLTGRQLHGSFENELHLPAVHQGTSLASRSMISTGMELVTSR